jgi:hypothetical protein
LGHGPEFYTSHPIHRDGRTGFRAEMRFGNGGTDYERELVRPCSTLQ